MKRGNSGENPIKMGELQMKYRVVDCLIEKIGRSDFLKLKMLDMGEFELDY